jgi:BirA family transcriptional regulator, biotin operon repressor / biotin---[acetyl-CoA-carboxylase] ligase
MSFGWPWRHFARTDSTNTRARELAAGGAPHGAIVTAAEQSEGRGRQGRAWTAPAGKALLYSAIVRPLEERHLVLPLAAPLAVCEAAEELAPGVECGVKWPNDVHLEGRKLAGVLIEARPQNGWAVVGVGLNLAIEADEFPLELRDAAISLFSSAAPPPSAGGQGHSGVKRVGAARPGRAAQARPGRPGQDSSGRAAQARSGQGPTGRAAQISPGRAAQVLSRRLARWVEADAESVLAAWRERDVLRGREVAWEGGSGVADGVDDRGYLLVVTPAGDRVAVGAGEVHLRL